MAGRALFANGCSMTYGSELADGADKRCVDDAYRERCAWPGALAERLGCERAVNLGTPSGSNERIVRTTIAWVLGEHLGRGRRAEDLLVVIGWSHPMRREFYIDGEWHQVVPYHDHAHPKLHRLNLVYREVAWHDHESAVRFLTALVSLESFLRLHQVPYLFFDALAPVQEHLAHAGDAGEAYLSQLDLGRYFGFDDFNGAMTDVLAEAFPDWPLRHPSAAGHAHWADLLAGFIRDNHLLTAGVRASAPPARARGERKRGDRPFVYR